MCPAELLAALRAPLTWSGALQKAQVPPAAPAFRALGTGALTLRRTHCLSLLPLQSRSRTVGSCLFVIYQLGLADLLACPGFFHEVKYMSPKFHDIHFPRRYIFAGNMIYLRTLIHPICRNNYGPGNSRQKSYRQWR